MDAFTSIANIEIVNGWMRLHLLLDAFTSIANVEIVNGWMRLHLLPMLK